MILDFQTMQTSVIPHFKGGEKEVAAQMFSDGRVRILRGSLAPGATIGPHTHEDSSEIIYLLCGSGKVLIDGGEEPFTAGQCHYCPKGHTHSLVNDSGADLVFFAVVPQQ